MKRVPAALAEVIEPLREAEEYGRFQLQRQRGIYNLLTGLPGPLFLAWFAPSQWIPATAPMAAKAVAVLGLLALFIASCSLPKLLLPWVKRRRPDWVAAFLEAPIVNKALEKQFWVQIGFAVGGLWVLPLGVAIVDSVARPPFGFLSFLGLALAVLHLVAMTVLAMQATRTGDRLVAVLYWILAPAAILVLLFGGDDPYYLMEETRIMKGALLEASFQVFFVSLVAPPLIAALIRLLAPRRWLVR